MANIEVTQLEEIENETLRALAKRVFLTTRLAADKAVAHAAKKDKFPLPDNKNAMEHLFLKRLTSRPSEIQERAKDTLMKSLKAPAQSRAAVLGDLAAVRLDSKASVESQVSALPFPPKLKIGTLGEIKLTGPLGMPPLVMSAPPAPAQVPHKKLTLRIHRVKCDDETGSFTPPFASDELGSDEITLGGTAVNVAGATTTKIKVFKVGDFDDGDVKVFTPLKPFCTFNSTKGTAFPKQYLVTLVLAEEDAGDLADFLDELSKKVEAKVKEEITKAGAESGDPLNIAIAMAVAWCVGKLFDFLRSAWGDDVFPPVTVTAKISAPTFGDKIHTPDQIAVFEGHGGQYQLRYDWLHHAA